jgi:cell wall-associated NlpC family hydrolase
VCILIVAALASSAAVAATTGGASAAPATPAPAATAPATPVKAPVHLDPVTAKTPKLAYNGPVYEKTATGEVIPYQPPVPAGQMSPTGGSPVGVTAATKPELLVPGTLARYVDGLAAAPMSVPAAVQAIVWAGNQLIGLPYIFGGGHASFISPGYDCSGTVSFALHGGSLLATPEDSSEFMVWGSHGAGRYVSIFANGGHAYMTVAGMRLDTSAADDPSNQQGPRWRPLRQGNEGFTVRHPLGL